MSDFVKEWFGWFEKGIEQVDQKEKEKFFSVCGMHCAETGIIKLYKDIYDKSCSNMDGFFSKFDDMKYKTPALFRGCFLLILSCHQRQIPNSSPSAPGQSRCVRSSRKLIRTIVLCALNTRRFFFLAK